MAISVKKKTIYSSLPVQVFMIHAIKAPIMEAVYSLFFNPKATFTEKAKALRKLWKAYQAFQKIPEPTKENTWHPNSHNLIDLRDTLFYHLQLGDDRWRVIKSIFNFVIILNDFDPPWRWIMDSVKDMALKMEWKPRGYEDTWSKNYHWWKE